METPRFTSVPTANFVDDSGGRHISPATEYREQDFSSYDRLIHVLGDETLGSMGISSTFEVEDLPTRVIGKNLGMSSPGAGHISKLLK